MLHASVAFIWNCTSIHEIQSSIASTETRKDTELKSQVKHVQCSHLMLFSFAVFKKKQTNKEKKKKKTQDEKASGRTAVFSYQVLAGFPGGSAKLGFYLKLNSCSRSWGWALRMWKENSLRMLTVFVLLYLFQQASVITHWASNKTLDNQRGK